MGRVARVAAGLILFVVGALAIPTTGICPDGGCPSSEELRALTIVSAIGVSLPLFVAEVILTFAAVSGPERWTSRASRLLIELAACVFVGVRVAVAGLA